MNGYTNKIEIVTISVNYSDLLAVTLPINAREVDKIIVVTDLKDSKTKEVCQLVNQETNNIVCFQTDIFYLGGGKLNKGAAIDIGLNKGANLMGFLGTVDADISLGKGFREKFLGFATDYQSSYSCRRYDIPTYKEWLEIQDNLELLKTKKLYRGIGYGNLFFWHQSSKIYQKLYSESGGWPYPAYFPNVASSDWVFRNEWSDWIYDPPLNDAPNQHEIPNNDRAEEPEFLKELPFFVCHLGETGKNEEKRITPEFK